MRWKVPLADVSMGPEELDAASRVLRSGWLSMGEVTSRFERAFAAYTGSRHALAVSNATAALHLAILALGIGRGDQVIVPALTFVATANALLYAGAEPVFADITGEADFSLSPAAVEAAITPRVRAIMVMHYGGYVCDMPAINAIAQRHGLAVIEDAAHAPGAALDGKKAGCLGDVGCFSFFANKNLTTGEGGMVVTDRDDLAERVSILRSHGMTSLTWDRHQGHAHTYDVVALGYNYRIDEMRSSLGLAQLEKLEENNQRRREITGWYWERLSGLPGLSLPYCRHRGIASAHLFPILLEAGIDRRRFMDEMKALGIQTSIHYPPVHQFSYHRQHCPAGPLPHTEAVGAREVTLPLYPAMSREDVETVAGAVAAALSLARTG